MEDEEVLCRFGTPLEPLEEDEIPSKKPIQIEDQIVTDKNGRRRFHGAFTGGFSAGFWNTVGSLEGWQPKEFKSSRAEKAEHHKQQLFDFMDDEDMGEFGIAPQRVQTTDDFTPQDKIGQKRKIQQKIDGPIPGVPVLQQLLRPAKEMVAIRLLKKMGWKQGQGIGARQTRKEKKVTAKRNVREQYIMIKYGCEIGENNSSSKDLDSGSDLSDSEEITFAPDDFEPYVCVIKDNTFGLGYTGLCRDPILKSHHVNLFGPLEIVDKDNKKLSIRGQAFGVGALEEEDEDIYQRDDMTKYDFTMGNTNKHSNIHKQAKHQESFVIDGFNISENTKKNKKIFKVSISENYKPRNWLKRKTRFEPLDSNRAEKLKEIDKYKIKGLGRHDLNPTERGRILENTSSSVKSTEKYENDKKYEENVKRKNSYLEKINEKYKDRDIKKRNDVLDMLSSKFDKFTNSEVIKEDGSIEKHSTLIKEDAICENVKQENDNVQSKASKITNKLDKSSGVFKPFLSDDLKQERYEKFLAQNLTTDDEMKKFLLTIQPLHMSEWDREIEKKEFLQAQKIYKPLKGMMKDRFVPECAIIAEREIKKVAKDCNEKLVTLRTKQMWKPCSDLCKRFNIAEPFGGTMIEEKSVKKTKFSVFDYLETSMNEKRNFITPVIIPKKAEIAKPIIQQKRISTKDLFSNELKSSEKTKEYFNKDNDDDNINSKSEKRRESIIVENSKVEKPKTDLEKKIEETKDQHPSEKKDLFKSIFESSSEDEDDEENKKKLVTSKTNDISKEIISILTKPASELNKLRNNLQPKASTESNSKVLVKTISIATTSKEEITQPIQKIIFKSKKQRLADENAQCNEKELSKEITQSKDPVETINVNSADLLESKNIVDDENIYGPKIPIDTFQNISSDIAERPSNPSVNINLDEKLINILKKNKKTKVVEEWVEKTEENCTALTLSSKKKKKKDKEKTKKSKKHKKNKKHKK